MNEQFGKETDFELKARLDEEIIPSDFTVWNHRTGIGNSGMNAVAQANGLDEIQLSNGHRKQQRKTLGRVKLIGNWYIEWRKTLS